MTASSNDPKSGQADRGNDPTSGLADQFLLFKFLNEKVKPFKLSWNGYNDPRNLDHTF